MATADGEAGGHGLLVLQQTLLGQPPHRRRGEVPRQEVGISSFLRDHMTTGPDLDIDPIDAPDKEALNEATTGSVRMYLNGDGEEGDEAYMLEVTMGYVDLRVGHGAGLLYAAQMLRQLVRTKKGEGTSSTAAVPAVLIKDGARFEWTGLHLRCTLLLAPRST